MHFNKYFPFVFIYFFVNSLGLPFGLTYMALLAPVFYVWILLVRKREPLLPFIIILFPFIILHITIVGVETSSYFISLLNLVLVYVFCQAVFTFLTTGANLEKIFRWILWVNFIVCIIAIPFYFTPWFHLVWDEQVLRAGVGKLRRLKMFTYEPSYYALLFTPLFFFFLLQYFFRQNRINGMLLLLMLFLPYILSFSIGVIGAALLSGVIAWIFYFQKLTRKRRIANAIITMGASVSSILVILVLFFRHNLVFTRIGNIFRGEDSSGNGRTIDAFIIAGKLVDEKNEYWGIGLGQIKILGESIIRSYYRYNIEMPITIPNAVAETFAIFGWAGVSLRFIIEIFFFFHTKVWNNYYRLLLYFFMFIYQFTGSFITNMAEYVIWILAFTNVFYQFNVRRQEAAESVH